MNTMKSETMCALQMKVESFNVKLQCELMPLYKSLDRLLKDVDILEGWKSIINRENKQIMNQIREFESINSRFHFEEMRAFNKTLFGSKVDMDEAEKKRKIAMRIKKDYEVRNRLKEERENLLKSYDVKYFNFKCDSELWFEELRASLVDFREKVAKINERKRQELEAYKKHLKESRRDEFVLSMRVKILKDKEALKNCTEKGEKERLKAEFLGGVKILRDYNMKLKDEKRAKYPNRCHNCVSNPKVDTQCNKCKSSLMCYNCFAKCTNCSYKLKRGNVEHCLPCLKRHSHCKHWSCDGNKYNRCDYCWR